MISAQIVCQMHEYGSGQIGMNSLLFKGMKKNFWENFFCGEK